MKKTISAYRLAWLAFVLQAAFFAILLAVSLHIWLRESQLMAKQPAMQASEARAKTRLQTERDIEQLRAAALHIQTGSDVTWQALLKMEGDFGAALQGLLLCSAMFVFLGGWIVYALRSKRSLV